MKIRFAQPRALSIVLALSSLTASGDDQLSRTIASLDQAVFSAYNACDLEEFARFFADDVEFYHDQTGLTRSRQTLGEAVKNKGWRKVRRGLVSGKVEGYPMQGYGAGQIGTHRFHPPGEESVGPVGEAKVIHLWQNSDGGWRITRVI